MKKVDELVRAEEKFKLGQDVTYRCLGDTCRGRIVAFINNMDRRGKARESALIKSTPGSHVLLPCDMLSKV